MTASKENMTSENIKFAGFNLRLLASLIDSLVSLLIISVFLNYLSSSPNTPEFFYRISLLLITVLLPFVLIGILYFSLSTSYFGATIGKFLTGIRVVSDSGSLLTVKRSLFRHTIGYQFAWVFFGLGYLSIIKDDKKQGWHDKASGSIVLIKNNFMALGLLVLALLLFVNFFFIKTSITQFSDNKSLQDDFSYLFISTKHQLESFEQSKNPTPPSDKIIDSTGSSQLQTN